MTAMSDPVNLPLPAAQPEPAPGCTICAYLAEQRAEARAAQDYSRVSDCNVGIRAHEDHQTPIPR